MLTPARLPLRVIAPPDALGNAPAPFLLAPLAEAAAVAGGAAPAGVRRRLLDRVAGSRDAAGPMVTSRLSRLAVEPLAPGVRAARLYERDRARPERPGEPLRARLIELAPGSRWDGPDAAHEREWLVLRGAVVLGGETLTERDFHAEPAGCAGASVVSCDGAVLFLREAGLPPEPGAAPLTVRDAEAGWPEFAPGIRRRVLWRHGDAASMLYYAEPGASVPHHAHGHDEECLMVQGELFLDDVLLQAGDYQLAPAGTGHRITQTDTGVVIYAHGDLDLRFVG